LVTRTGTILDTDEFSHVGCLNKKWLGLLSSEGMVLRMKTIQQRGAQKPNGKFANEN
jgi:hypothetical protein